MCGRLVLGGHEGGRLVLGDERQEDAALELVRLGGLVVVLAHRNVGHLVHRLEVLQQLFDRRVQRESLHVDGALEGLLAGLFVLLGQGTLWVATDLCAVLADLQETLVGFVQSSCDDSGVRAEAGQTLEGQQNCQFDPTWKGM